MKLENFPYKYTALFNEESVENALKNAKGFSTGKGMRFGSTRGKRKK